MNWILIGVVLLALFLFFKFVHFKKRLAFFLIVLLFLFFYLSFVVIARNHSIDFKTPSGLLQIGKVYLSWFSQLFSNMKSVTSYIVSTDWIPESNSSSSLKSDFSTKGIMKG